MNTTRLLLIALLLAAPAPAVAQDVVEPDPEPTPAPAPAGDEASAEPTEGDAVADEAADAADATEQPADQPPPVEVEEEDKFIDASAAMKRRAEDAVAEYSALQERIKNDLLPLSRQLTELERKLAEARKELTAAKDKQNNQALQLVNLRKQTDARADESQFVANFLSDYIRNFKSELHVAEKQSLREVIEAAELAAQDKTLSQQDIFKAQLDLVDASAERLEKASGGYRFRGRAVSDIGETKGLVVDGTFVFMGPAAVFASSDGAVVGVADVGLESDEPRALGFLDPTLGDAVADLVANEKGFFTLDPTLGSAQLVAETEETLIEHARKGGPVMYPIVGMAAAMLLVALFKWTELTLVRNPSRRHIAGLIRAVEAGDEHAALGEAKRVGGPTGRMLTAGVEHIRMPRALIEEVMYEKVLEARLKLNRFLPFIAICAASAPLLGLLGTVTGIINTFKLITVYGTGDAKTLSGGISEALITTEFGLIVAIPSLLLHAFLARKARAKIDTMEKAAVELVNQIGKTPMQPKPDDSGDEQKQAA